MSIQFKKIVSKFFIFLSLFFYVNNLYAYQTRENSINSFLTLLYQDILGRNADEEGIKYWQNALYTDNKTATDVTRYFFTSSELEKQGLSDDEFIKRVYKTLLDRKPDKEGYNYWMDMLQNKKIPRLQLFYRFVFSKEFEEFTLNHGIMPYDKKDLTVAFLERFYNLILERNSDGFGLDYWYEELRSKKKTPQRIAKDFFYSKELLKRELSDKKFIEISYRTLLNREPEKEGFEYWLDKLQNGYGRDDLLDDFLASNEFKEITDRFLKKDIPVLKDIYPPSFSLPSVIVIDDNQTFITKLEALDHSLPIEFGIEDTADKEFFKIVQNELYLKNPLFFRTPKDNDKDNVYEVSISAKDANNNKIIQNTKIKVCPDKMSQIACKAGIYQLSSFGIGDKAYALTKRGDFVFVVDRYTGLKIVDVKDPSHPVLESSLKIDDFLMDITLYKDYLFIAGGKEGIKVVDISDIKNPKLIGTDDKSDGSLRVYVYENYLFSVNSSNSIDIYDITDPKNPLFLNSIDTDITASSVFVKDDLAYITVEEEGLFVYDISDVSKPLYLGSFKTYANAKDVVVYKNNAYIACFNEGIKIVDVKDPKNLKLVKSVKLDSRVLRVAIRNDYLFAADLYAGLKVIDILDPKNAKISGIFSTYKADDLFIDEKYAYIADDEEGLKILDISNPVIKGIVSDMSIEKGAYRIAVGKERAFVADFNKNLQIIDINSSIKPLLVGSLYLQLNDLKDIPKIGVNEKTDISLLSETIREEDYINDIKVEGNYLFLANGSKGVKIIDISDKNKTKVISSLSTESSVSSLFKEGNYLYIGNSEGILNITDISNPNSPKIISSYKLDIKPDHIVANGNIVYVASSDSTMKMIDVKDPKKPKFISSFRVENEIYNMDLKGDHLFVANGKGGVKIADIKDPKNLKIISSFPTKGYVHDLKIVGNELFLADLYNGLIEIDISNLKKPEIVANIPLYGILGVDVNGDFAYTADFNKGFHIIDLKEAKEIYKITNK